MPVLLRRSSDLPDTAAYDAWLAVTGTLAPTPAPTGLGRKLPGLACKLEAAFVAERDAWLRLGRALAAEPGADVAHMPTAGSFGSDFGIMLAWCRLVGGLARDDTRMLVLCDDPWLFRHLAGLPGIEAGLAPALRRKVAWRALRGVFARVGVAFRAAWAALRLRRSRRAMRRGDSVILVYGHPASDARGNDAYFGDLMARFPALKRLLHTDCGVARARALAADGRTASLHAWGSPLFALTLIGERWRPGRAHLAGPLGWLVRRAAASENGGGGPAMNRWQAHCQARWLAAARPARVAWPWENHGWERNLCRAARQHGVKLIGYQHTVIGPHHFNYSTATNPDGLSSIPDFVVANGPVYLAEMRVLGVPAERLMTGGAVRFRRFRDDLFDAAGPLFVPLSPVVWAARAQFAVAAAVARRGWKVLVRQHPMYPMPFSEQPNLAHGDAPLADQSGLSAVLYATGTSGLEAVLMGIPAFRLMLDDRISIDVLPAGIAVTAVTEENAAETILAHAGPGRRVPWDDILSDPDIGVWKSLLFDDIEPAGIPKAAKQAS